MPGKFQWRKFRDVDLNDPFFDSLKLDYPEFVQWFTKKSNSGEETLIYNDDTGVGAFLYLKDEYEEIEMVDQILPRCRRIKIGTLRLSDRQRGIRLGEGAIGVALWKWQEKQVDEIYVTVFDTHSDLIMLFERFGFSWIGNNARGERIYIKNRNNLSYSDPYKSFPFINGDVEKAGILPIKEDYHDRLFPYSELMGNKKQIEEITAGNGVTKVYIGTPFTSMHYKVGEPVFIYRIYESGSGATYKSAVTSFGTITKITVIKSEWKHRVSLEDYLKMAGNKTVYDIDELEHIYNKDKVKNIIMLELVYNGFFGKGNNVNHKTLNDKGLFPMHPYNIDYTIDNFINILEMGDINVQNVIIDKSRTCG